jgi:hypothetical protein
MSTASTASRSNRRRNIFLIILLILGIAAYAGYRYYNKPAARAEDEKAVAVTAEELLRVYQSDSATANRQYLDKWIAVTGVVTSSEVNQSGQNNIFFGSDEDPFAPGISCAMREKSVSVKAGDRITLKGRCTGMATDVIVADCILQK